MKLEEAKLIHVDRVWEIIQEAIQRRKKEGSEQWQDGYPNLQTIKNDIDTKSGYVLIDSERIVAYVAIKTNDEPEYEKIDGNWLTNTDFLVLHRVAVAKGHLGRGVATKIFELAEDIAKEKQIYSIKVDTNFDNEPMLKIFKRLNYQYCGKVYFRGSERKAFEKVIKN